jgi:ribonucleotide reductase alpha subunit
MCCSFGECINNTGGHGKIHVGNACSKQVHAIVTKHYTMVLECRNGAPVDHLIEVEFRHPLYP